MDVISCVQYNINIAVYVYIRTNICTVSIITAYEIWCELRAVSEILSTHKAV